jgi:hypothetical protein
MAVLFPLGLGLPSRQTIFMLTSPFTMLLLSIPNNKFQAPNLRVSGVRFQVSEKRNMEAEPVKDFV